MIVAIIIFKWYNAIYNRRKIMNRIINVELVREK